MRRWGCRRIRENDFHSQRQTYFRVFLKGMSAQNTSDLVVVGHFRRYDGHGHRGSAVDHTKRLHTFVVEEVEMVGIPRPSKEIRPPNGEEFFVLL